METRYFLRDALGVSFSEVPHAKMERFRRGEEALLTPQQNGSDWIRFADVDHAEPIFFKERVGVDGFLLPEGAKAHAAGQTRTISRWDPSRAERKALATASALAKK